MRLTVRRFPFTIRFTWKADLRSPRDSSLTYRIRLAVEWLAILFIPDSRNRRKEPWSVSTDFYLCSGSASIAYGSLGTLYWLCLD